MILTSYVIASTLNELTRSECKNHFEKSVLPLLLLQLPRVRPGLKISKWQDIQREDRTEWQPNGVPTRRLGFTFERTAKVEDLEVSLAGKYMVERPAEVHGSISVTKSGQWSGNNWQVAFLRSLRIATEFVKPYTSDDRSAFPKVKLGNLSWELWTGPLASSSVSGTSTVTRGEFRALAVFMR